MVNVLDYAIEQRCIYFWNQHLQKANFEKRLVEVIYDDQTESYYLTSKDDTAVLAGYPATVIRENGWYTHVYDDYGLQACIYAPANKLDFIKNLFEDPQRFKLQ